MIKYIFCINTGRCGSDYLTELLSKAENTVSFHEAYPYMNGNPMQKFNDGDEDDLRQLMSVKLREIRKKSKNGRRIYCETNHAFIKGWGYLIPEYIPQEEIGVIILRKDWDRVAYNFIRDHKIVDTTEHTRNYMLRLDNTRNLSKPPAQASPYEVTRWYIKETYLRGEQYKQMFPYVKYFECNVEQLNDYKFVETMFATFGLVPTPQLKNVVGVHINVKKNYPQLSLDELLAPPKYPSADSLNGSQRDTLIYEMIAYLREKKADEIARIQPQYATNTIMYGLRRMVGYAQQELEDVFKYSLKFTETEDILWKEFLWTINPKDPAFVLYERSKPPGIFYTTDTNITQSMKTAVQKLGLSGMFQVIMAMLKGHWSHDPTHRVKDPWNDNNTSSNN